jgi:hypothetical protein
LSIVSRWIRLNDARLGRRPVPWLRARSRAGEKRRPIHVRQAQLGHDVGVDAGAGHAVRGAGDRPVDEVPHAEFMQDVEERF